MGSISRSPMIFSAISAAMKVLQLNDLLSATETKVRATSDEGETYLMMKGMVTRPAANPRNWRVVVSASTTCVMI
jgi:hypothetical protein